MKVREVEFPFVDMKWERVESEKCSLCGKEVRPLEDRESVPDCFGGWMHEMTLGGQCILRKARKKK